jgi:hypothetical protein
VKNSSQEPREGTTYTSGHAAREVQDGRVRAREGRSGGQEAATVTTTAGTEPHADRLAELDIELTDVSADVPGPVRQRGRRRRTVTVAVLGILVLLVALVLLSVRSSGTESELAPAAGGYAGDWKDVLVEQGGSQPYTEDWKDLLP